MHSEPKAFGAITTKASVVSARASGQPKSMEISRMRMRLNKVLLFFGMAASFVVIYQQPAAAQPAACMAQSANTSNFNGTPIQGGNFIWFSANLKASGIPSTGARILFQNARIHFVADQDYILVVPNAQVTFSPSAVCASTSFDTLTQTWMTTVPLSGSDEIFLSGLAFPVPASFANVGGKVAGPVTWQGTFFTDVPITVDWKWGAAVYTTFSTDYNQDSIKPTHSNSCAYANSDHAGTPQGFDTSSGNPFKSFVIGGARGGGGSNFTGSWSGTQGVTTVCASPGIG